MCNAIDFVRGFTQEVTQHGGVVLAIFLDIVNAFNTLPWHHIMGALERHSMPLYLRRILQAYLKNRRLNFRDRTGAVVYIRACRKGQSWVPFSGTWDMTKY